MPTHSINNNWARLLRSTQRQLEPVAAWIATIPILYWQRLALAILAAIALADCARLIWLLVPAKADAPLQSAPINVTAAAATKSSGSIEIDKLIGWHLFGEVGAQPHVAAAEVEAQAQETTLNLQLLGVIAASDPAFARAFILIDGQQKQFAVGESLPVAGRVLLNKVLVDRAIIDNNGRLETLWLYDPNSTSTLKGSSNAPAATSTVDMRNDAGVTQMAAGFKNQLYQNPMNLADVIQVAPASENGKLIGYRINPGRDPALFAKFGLRPGDIVTSINSINLDDPQRALELYNVLRSQTEASVTVRRGNEDVVVRVSMQDMGAPN